MLEEEVARLEGERDAGEKRLMKELGAVKEKNGQLVRENSAIKQSVAELETQFKTLLAGQ